MFGHPIGILFKAALTLIIDRCLQETSVPLQALSTLYSLDKHLCTISTLFGCSFHTGYVEVRAWGAGGASYGGRAGGPGAFLQATIPVTPGQTLTVLVGTTGGGYGFGQSSAQFQSAGGGLVGVFQGDVPITGISQDNALLIAGVLRIVVFTFTFL